MRKDAIAMLQGIVALLGAAELALFVACGTSNTTTTSPGIGTNTGVTAATGTGTAAAASLVNGCADGAYIDMTGASAPRAITWDLSVGTLCWKVKVGHTVTWNGDLATHPLTASGGDAAGNPIPARKDSGTSHAQVFGGAGTFGFKCGVHATMKGAIRVVP